MILEQVKDPVCGMTVDPKKSKLEIKHAGETYYFCSGSCKNKFHADPDKYLSKTSLVSPPKSSDKNTLYTCPMHPEVEQIGPGSCPKCGMDLEPKTPGLEEEQDDPMLRRFWVSLVPTVLVFIIAMSEMVPSLKLGNYFSHDVLNWAQFLMATPVVLYGGSIFFTRGWQSIRSLNFNMFSLIAIGTGVAYIFSVFSLFFPEVITSKLNTSHGGANLYFEAAAVVILLVLLGQVLETRARKRTGTAIKELLNLSPQTALVIGTDGIEIETPLSHVEKGMILKVKPGERIPVDGTITEGKSLIDESMVTGEPIPVEKSESQNVTGGTLNQTGSFLMEAKRVKSETFLAQIVQMVSDAQRTRAPIQKTADQIASWFVPSVMFISILAFIIWYFFGPAPEISNALIAAISVLIIACPCALGLATPMSIMVASGRGAQAGILLKDAESIETFEKIDILIVDKTGTLTEGKPSVSTLEISSDFSSSGLLEFAASIENNSEHPLAQAIVNKAKQDNLKLHKVEEFQSITGKGVQGIVKGKKVLLGNPNFLTESGLELTNHIARITELQSKGQTVLLVSIENKFAGLIGVSDKIKETTKEALALLKQDGVEVRMATGDSKATAEAVAKELGIKHVNAGASPEDKKTLIKQLQKEGFKVAMAGDGINDAPALAQANVGIAMGTGTQVAIESAGITLIHGDLRDIARTRILSRATMKNIRQNLFFAFGYNVLGIPIAAGILYPWFGLLLNPMISGLAMSLSSISVIANSLRLKNLNL